MKKHTGFFTEKELEKIEKILQETEQKNTTGTGCLLVKYIPQISDKSWQKISSSKELCGWNKIALEQKNSLQSIQAGLEQLHHCAQISLAGFHSIEESLHTINLEIQRVERGSGEFSVLMIRPFEMQEEKKRVHTYMYDVLASCVRAYDTIQLIDEEYFIAILPGASASNARLFAKRYQSILKHTLQEQLSTSIEIPIYIGLSTYRAGMPVSAQKIIEYASTALQEGMQAGHSVHQVSSHLLGDLDRASMVGVAEKRLLFAKKEG